MIFFSVIIPTYNRAGFITETVQSVLKQTVSDFEIIIVDDGSTDNTEEVIRHFFSAEPRLHYYKKTNEERGAARNFGLRQAKGRFAVFFDSDDLMKPHYLQTLLDVIHKTPGIFLLACKYNFLLPAGKEVPAPVQSLKEGWYDRDFFLKGNILACNYCIRITDKSYKLFPPDRELASMEDWLFILANTERNKVFIKDEVCLSMREHDERSMVNNQKVIAARQKAAGWAKQNLQLSNSQLKTLDAWSHYFCGIHQYLDGRRREAIKETWLAMRLGGINKKFILLLIKSILGRKLIKKLK